MTDPKPPIPTVDGPVNNRRVLIVLASAVLAIILLLGGIEVFSQLSKRAPVPTPVAGSAAEARAPVAAQMPVVEAQPEPIKLAQPAPVVEPKPEPAPPEPVVAPKPVVEPEPAPVVVTPEPRIVAETPVAPVETPDPPTPELSAAPVEAEPKPEAPATVEVAGPVAVDLAVTTAKGEPPTRSTGEISWSASSYPSLSTQYAGTITFASGGTATIVFTRSFVATPALTVDLVAKDGPLQGVAAIAVLRADGKDIAIDVGLQHTTLADSGAADGSFQTLADATGILLALLFENGDTATLKLTKPPKDGLETVLLPDGQPGQ